MWMETTQIRDLINEINNYTKDKLPIKVHIDRIGAILDEITDFISPSLMEVISSNLKSKVQRDANSILDVAKGTGALLMATGSGKSKVAIDRIGSCIRLLSLKSIRAKILVVVPTEKLRDSGWIEEIKWWNMEEILEYIDIVCYASLKNIRDSEYHLVILDEGHNLTPHSAEFFFNNNNKVSNIVLLTATKPEESEKKALLSRLGVFPVYILTLDEAVKLRIVAPYEITIIKVPLNGIDRYIQAGNKAKRFYTTEAAQYEYINRTIGTEDETEISRKIRYKFFGNLRSKTEAALKLLKHLIPQDKRVLIFASSKLQADALCTHKYYTGYKKKDEDLALFMAEQISRMACIEAINEGHNIPNLDCCLKLKLDSRKRKIVQQLGRNIRFRANHVGKFIVLCSENTVEEEWMGKAVANFDQSRVNWVTLEDIRTMRYVINFND